VSVRRSADASPAGRPPGTRVVWRLWSEPPDLVQTGSGTRLDLLALCPEESGAKPAALLPWGVVGPRPDDCGVLAAGCGWPVRTLTGCLVRALAVVVPASRCTGS
jgi:hypothetical protein